METANVVDMEGVPYNDAKTNPTPDPEPERLIYRFVGNHLSINVHLIAYVLNILGANVTPEAYERMPHEVKEHFVLVKM